MNADRKIIGTVLLAAILSLTPGTLRAEDVFAECSVSSPTASYGESVTIKLSVYTRSWFTDGVQFPQMENQDGILLRNGRSYSHKVTENGISYTAVTQEYIYYPLTPGDYFLKFGQMKVSTPLSGEYMGRQMTVDVSPARLMVEESPAYRMHVTPSADLSVSQTFEVPDSLSPGDVIVRNITIKAKDVPAAFISPVTFRDSSHSSISMTAERPRYSTSVSDGIVEGRMSMKIYCQVSDSGEVRLPQIRIPYWNTSKKRAEVRVLEGRAFHVRPEDVHDAIQASVQVPEVKQKEKTSVFLRRIMAVTALSIVVMTAALSVLKIMSGNSRTAIFIRLVFCRDPFCFHNLLYAYARKSECLSFRELALTKRGLDKRYSEIDVILFGKTSAMGKPELPFRKRAGLLLRMLF